MDKALQEFILAYDNVDVGKLDDADLEEYVAICNNGLIEAEEVKRYKDQTKE